MRRPLTPLNQELKGNIRVFTRVRPSDEDCVLNVDEENGSISLPWGGSFNTFKFDRAFSSLSTQDVRQISYVSDFESILYLHDLIGSVQ